MDDELIDDEEIDEEIEDEEIDDKTENEEINDENEEVNEYYDKVKVILSS
jgi:hypothetical protein